ncbi:hypothetical protein [Metapseudomonas otitidis]|uniref:hypothetical protein n=1 Tax=Metapseudomonas otitidis TaxID=319939 RepID=UPI0024470651|nr:hypothetical protein [Pseudomonas otitidis]MDH0339842.1 hypothetical protein [Pseudomonas otitidis]
MLTIEEHRSLRFALESEITARVPDTQLASDLLSACMSRVLVALETQDATRAELDRQFREFHRNPDARIPSWAFNKPGSRPKYQPLR